MLQLELKGMKSYIEVVSLLTLVVNRRGGFSEGFSISDGRVPDFVEDDNNRVVDEKSRILSRNVFDMYK